MNTQVKLETRVADLEARIAKLEEQINNRRGPKSEREMTDDDARRVIGGDLKDKSHKECAAELGLSYAQVYSCRKHFTFKHIHKEFADKPVVSTN